jgi:hypothetical protein
MQYLRCQFELVISTSVIESEPGEQNTERWEASTGERF